MPNDIDRFDGLKENYEGCDFVGDFFESSLVKRAYGELWNEVYLKNPQQIRRKDFDIFKKEHLSFIRTVFEDLELSQRFLQILRNNSLKLQSKDAFIYENKQILSFLVVWQDLQDRVSNYSETLPEIFKEKIIDIVSNVGGNMVYEDPKDENNFISFAEGIGNLLKAGFPCIDSEGNLIFGFPTIPQVFDFFDVVDTQGRKFSINKKGEEISEAETIKIAEDGVMNLKKFFEKIIEFLNTGKDYSQAPEEMIPTLGVIIQDSLTGEETPEEARNIITQYFLSQIQEAEKKIKAMKKREIRATFRVV